MVKMAGTAPRASWHSAIMAHEEGGLRAGLAGAGRAERAQPSIFSNVYGTPFSKGAREYDAAFD